MTAAVVAAAAARRQRLERVLDAFRLAGATTPERARPLADLGLAPSTELDALLDAGVISGGGRQSTWYLNEAAYIAFRDRQQRLGLRIALVASLAILAVLLVFLSATWFVR